jgi:hypothetical protein
LWALDARLWPFYTRTFTPRLRPVNSPRALDAVFGPLDAGPLLTPRPLDTWIGSIHTRSLRWRVRSIRPPGFRPSITPTVAFRRWPAIGAPRAGRDIRPSRLSIRSSFGRPGVAPVSALGVWLSVAWALGITLARVVHAVSARIHIAATAFGTTIVARRAIRLAWLGLCRWSYRRRRPAGFARFTAGNVRIGQSQPVGPFGASPITLFAGP